MSAAFYLKSAFPPPPFSPFQLTSDVLPSPSAQQRGADGCKAPGHGEREGGSLSQRWGWDTVSGASLRS